MSFDVWTYVARMGARMKLPNDSFFLDGDAVCGMRTAHYFGGGGGAGDDDGGCDDEEFLHADFAPFQCLAPGCKATFTQLLDSEAHYAAKHRHSCSVCHKSLPSNHLLELHVMENHDSFFQVMAEKKPSYACFLETCDQKYWNAEERREHCIQSHKFPANFKFDSSKHQKKSKQQQQNKKKPSEKNKAGGSKHKKEGRQKECPSVDMSVDDTDYVKQQQVLPTQTVTSQKDEPMHHQQEATSPAVHLRKFSFGSQKKQQPRREVDRRFSLYNPPAKNDSGSTHSTHSTSQPNSPDKVRGPVSLSRVGERLSLQMPPPSPTKKVTETSVLESPYRLRASSLAGSKSNIPQLIRKKAVVPATAAAAPQSAMSPRKQSRFSSTSSSSPEHSKLIPSSSASSNSSHTTNIKKDQQQHSTPKSKIPVLRTSSCKVPREICFGYGVNRSFSQRISNWYQKNTIPSDATLKSIEKTNFDDMKMALD